MDIIEAVKFLLLSVVKCKEPKEYNTSTKSVQYFSFRISQCIIFPASTSIAAYSTDVHIGETEGEGWRQTVATLAWPEDSAPSSERTDLEQDRREESTFQGQLRKQPYNLKILEDKF